MKKQIITVLTVLALVSGGLMLSGCPGTAPDGTVEVVVPNVDQFAQTAEALAAVARVTYLGENAASVKVVLDQVIGVVGGAEGSVSALILATVDEAIEAGKLEASFKLFFIGVMGVIENYVRFNDFDINDVLKILQAASDGLGDGVSTQSASFAW